MTSLRYTLRDAHRWAAFSGDYNPIHFDPQWVKATGGDTLSVHGMRALLDVKRFISPQSDSAPFLKCTVRLRKPLCCDTTYRLIRDSKKAAAATVTDIAGEQSCFSCRITPEKSLPASAVESHYVLEQKSLAGLQQTFAPLLPDAQQWHFLDALLFRHLIQDDALPRQAAIAANLPKNMNMEALFSRYPVVQTHQEVIFDSRLLKPWHQDLRPDALHINTLPALVAGSLQHGLIVRIAAKTRYQDSDISNAITLKIGMTAGQ